VRRLETDGGSRDEFESVVAMVTRRHTGEVLVNRCAVRGSVYSGTIYWRQASSSHYFITPIPRTLLSHSAVKVEINVTALSVRYTVRFPLFVRLYHSLTN